LLACRALQFLLVGGSKAAFGRIGRKALQRKGIGRSLSIGSGDLVRSWSRLILRACWLAVLLHTVAANYFPLFPITNFARKNRGLWEETVWRRVARRGSKCR
jgi:hypothetical protein